MLQPLLRCGLEVSMTLHLGGMPAGSTQMMSLAELCVYSFIHSFLQGCLGNHYTNSLKCDITVLGTFWGHQQEPLHV